MKTKNVYIKYLNDFLRFLGKIPRAIVSGIASQKVYSRPNKKSTVYQSDEDVKPDVEKHYHRPVAKPVVEKQTLLKETKKVKGQHKK